jgi:hypothetical protein
MNFERLKMNGDSILISMQYQPTTIFINEHGVAELIKKSNSPIVTGIPKRKYEEVYVATTALYVKDQVYKIGKSYNSKRRIKTMNSGRQPSDDMHRCHVMKCQDALNAESNVHTVLSKYRISKNREFFKADLDEIVKTVNNVCSLYS